MEIKSSYPKTKRSDGRYVGYAYIEGRREETIKYAYDTDIQLCRQKLNDIIDDLEAGIIDSDIKFKAYCEKWLEIHCANLADTTTLTYEKKIKSYVYPKLEKRKLKDISQSDVQSLINAFAETHSEKSQKDLVGILHTIFNCAIKKDRLIKYNPVEGIKIKRTTPYEYSVYDINQMQELLNILVGHSLEIPVVLAALCALRMSEVCGLKWEDIDFENNLIKINKACVSMDGEIYKRVTKSRTSTRDIVAPDYVMNLLRKNRGLPGAYVYPKADGTPESGKNVGLRFNRFLKRMKLPSTRFHDLRHFAATTMMAGGVSDKEISVYLGHSNTKMTKQYQHIVEKMKSKPASIMDKHFDNVSSQNSSQNEKQS